MTQRARDHLGRFGVWRGSALVTPELVVDLERFGYGTVWLGGSPDGDLRHAEELIEATSTLTVATSIVNMWKDDARTVAASFARIEANHPGRFLLGVGAGHPEATQEYANPYDTLVGYVDVLLGNGVPADSLVLAALGPRVLRLAAERTAGAIPYLVTPQHTRQARTILGADKVLAPEQKAVLETDPQRARAIGRPRVQRPYLGLVNYTSNLRRLGWSEEDLRDGGSDALIDALVAWGTGDEVAAKLNEHLEAGADHVAVQLLAASDDNLTDGYRKLADALGLSG
jgi:probable F420-dependent oxidoreductase